jgi:hypothetical protein
MPADSFLRVEGPRPGAVRAMKEGNPWVQAQTLFRSAVDVLRAEVAMTAREIADALVADKAPQATRKQAIDLQAAILALAEARRVDGYWRGGARPVEIGCRVRVLATVDGEAMSSNFR